MQWIKIDLSKGIGLTKMLWLDINDTWFEGKLVDDTDYGLCIVTADDEYVPVDQITHYMEIKLPEPPFVDKDMGHGKCMEKFCSKFAVTDYNGHGHWVCQSHDDSLNRYFEEEYR